VYSWLVRYLLRRVIAQGRAGNIDPTIARYADDAHFRFPGRSSWAADYHDKAAIAAWLRRFVAVGLQLEPQEILVKGGPWNTTVSVHFTDFWANPEGEVIYANEGVLFGTMAWGKLKAVTVFEDTQKVADFDEYLEAHALGVR
jgi:hypothetical protein